MAKNMWRAVWPAAMLLSTYISASLFDIWFHLPNLAQPITLAATLLGSYAITRLGLNKSIWGWPRDYGTKYFIILMLTVGLFYAQDQADNRIYSALRINFSSPSSEMKISAWVIPPDYTGRDNIELAEKLTLDELLNQPHNLSVFEGSQLKLDVESSAHKPRLSSAEGSYFFYSEGKNNYSTIMQISQTGQLVLKLGAGKQIAWDITVEFDLPPTIAFTTTPRSLPNDNLEIRYQTYDDHLVFNARFNFRKPGSDGGQVFTHDLTPLQKQEPDSSENQQSLDLTASMWAGTMVFGWLTVEDAIGQVTSSDILQFRLPKRSFSNPVAQNIINIRQSLLFGPTPKEVLGERLKLQSDKREQFNNDYVVYLALRTAYWRLSLSNPTNISLIADLLWDTALRLEENTSDHLA